MAVIPLSDTLFYQSWVIGIMKAGMIVNSSLNLMIRMLSMQATALSYLSPRNTTAAAILPTASSPPRSC